MFSKANFPRAVNTLDCGVKGFEPFSQTTTFRQLKDFTDDNLKFDENGRKFSKGLENTVGKGGIARYEQFLLFPQCFQKTCTAET